MSISIVDVAKHAGVSIATVSRVVNDTGYPVSSALRQKVLDSAKALNFVPNRSAQALRRRMKNGIALIVRNISDPYFSEIERGVTETAIKNDIIATVFSSMQDTEFEMKYYQLILKQQYDGVIIGAGAYGRKKSTERLQSIVRELQQQGSRVIALAPQGFAVPIISVDNVLVGKRATEFLISKGHKDIAFFGGYRDHLVDGERFSGYQQALASHELIYDPEKMYLSDYSAKGGYENCEKLLDSGAHVSAIYCSNDHIAYGAIKCVTERGLKVPDDISIVGTGGFYSDSEYIGGPGLTSVHFPFYRLGELAVSKILGDDEIPNDYREILETKIVENSSVRMI